MAMDPDRVDELVEQASRALADGHPLRALALADQLASLNPEDVTTRIIRAHALLATDSLEDGLREAQVATLLDSESDDAYLVLALAAWRMRRLSVAEASFERAVDLSGHRSDFAAQYAWFLASERQATKAVRAAERVIGESPRTATAWAALGLAQYRLQRSELAEKSLRRALELDPKNPEAQSAMIRLLKRRGQHRQAGLLEELLDQTRHRNGLFAEGLPDSSLPGEVITPEAEQAKPTISKTDPAVHARWAWRISVFMIGFAALLAVVPLFLRAPILGLASLVTAVSIIAIARFWKR